MKVLTIKEPYASLISKGIKKYEFRTWKTNYRGEVLLHAGKGFDKKNKKLNTYKLNYLHECIIAKAKITDCIKVDDKFREQLKRENEIVYSNIIYDKTWNGYAFKLENVESIKPIEIKGQLGLWNIDDEYINKPIIWTYLTLLGFRKAPNFLKKYLEVPSLTRLKNIGYFCGMDYASNDIYNFKEFVSRYDHSLAVALITWKYTNDKKATIAALFHDISTPVFSHAIDYMNKDYTEQESTEEFTEKIVLSDNILQKYLKQDNITSADIINFKNYTVVDNNRPKICADRLDGIFMTSLFWTNEFSINEVKKYIKDVTLYTNEYNEKELGFINKETAKKIIDANKLINEYCHSSNDIYLMNLLGEITKESIDNGYFTYEELFTLDETYVMKTLKTVNNNKIKDLIKQFKTIKKEDIPVLNIPNIKERNINPLVDGKRYFDN